ncbi:MAG TPA: hypothetical protein VGG64_09730, partial [Pirellulales bacterium]
MSMPTAPKTRRRWFQFILASLFVLTTLVAIWLAWETAFIRERKAWIAHNPAMLEQDPSSAPVAARIPWWRKLLGDEAVPSIAEPVDWSDEDCSVVA